MTGFNGKDDKEIRTIPSPLRGRWFGFTEPDGVARYNWQTPGDNLSTP